MFHPDTKSHFCTSICLSGLVAPFSRTCLSPRRAVDIGRSCAGERGWRTAADGPPGLSGRKGPDRPESAQSIARHATRAHKNIGAQNMKYDSIWAALHVCLFFIYANLTVIVSGKLIASTEYRDVVVSNEWTIACSPLAASRTCCIWLCFDVNRT